MYKFSHYTKVCQLQICNNYANNYYKDAIRCVLYVIYSRVMDFSVPLFSSHMHASSCKYIYAIKVHAVKYVSISEDAITMSVPSYVHSHAKTV